MLFAALAATAASDGELSLYAAYSHATRRMPAAAPRSRILLFDIIIIFTPLTNLNFIGAKRPGPLRQRRLTHAACHYALSAAFAYFSPQN